ncbi:hypothetical protein [uncultured Pseudoteredinibacter sp.]|uniref:hypothetical protein n=1 Tax=uncultured Pseudoteredinibacter sp. TaxID=1641701 RepID=UPI0026016297|nr:hypothetical protein [uncultured Pseudoteredinibacter sp.]
MSIPLCDLPSILNSFYVDQDSIASIVEKYSYLKGSNLHKSFPLYKHDGLICEHCGDGLSSRFARKTAVETGCDSLCFDLNSSVLEELGPKDNGVINQYGWRRSNAISQDVVLKTSEGYLVEEPYCVSCQHRPQKTCSCDGCRKIKAKNHSLVLEGLLRPKACAQVEVEALNCREVFWALMAITYANKEGGLSVDDSGRRFLVDSGVYKVVASSYSQAIVFTSINEYRVRENIFEYQYDPSVLGGKDEAASRLKARAFRMVQLEESRFEVLGLWMDLALYEALRVMEYYCNEYSIPYGAGEKTISSVRKSLRVYGLAQTARYICNAVRFANRCRIEKHLNGRQAFNRIYSSLNFWIDDDRARGYNAPPFVRRDGVLSEPKSVIVFSSSFLELNDIDYFKTPITMREL